MAQQKGRTKIKRGLRTALDGVKAELERARDELGKNFDTALTELKELGRTVRSDDDVARAVSGVKSLVRRGAQRVADLFKEDPPNAPKG